MPIAAPARDLQGATLEEEQVPETKSYVHGRRVQEGLSKGDGHDQKKKMDGGGPKRPFVRPTSAFWPRPAF